MTEISAAYSRLPANARGALWMLASALTFTIMTSLVKFLGDGYSPALQTFYRQAVGVVLLLPLMLRNSGAVFRANRWGILLLRALMSTGGVILAFYSYQHMRLADANALSFTRALWVVPLAAVFLGETVGPWRLGATVIGFGGVLLMLRPEGDGELGLAPLAALASALLFAVTVTGMKSLTRDNSVLTISVWGATLGFFLSIPFAIAEWRWPSLVDFALLSGMGALGLLNGLFYIKGISLGDAAAMAPIDYTRLVFALIIGFFVFHETPSWLTLLGGLIVIASTLAITLREARLAKGPPLPPAD